MNGRGHCGKIRGNVVLEPVLADEVQQLLHSWNLNYAGASEGIQRIIGESALANVATHLARSVISREAGKTHPLGLDQPYASAKRVLFSYGTGNNLLKIHLH